MILYHYLNPGLLNNVLSFTGQSMGAVNNLPNSENWSFIFILSQML